MSGQPTSAHPTRLLLTGFEPFGGDRTNTSWEIVRAIATRGVPDVELLTLRLPVEFERAGRLLLREIAESSPDAIVCLGLALGRRAITPERVALNMRDSGGGDSGDGRGRPDNAGATPHDAPIDPAGPFAYPSALPVRACVAAAVDAGAPAALSHTAGTYVCNDVFYTLMRHRDVTGDHRPGGFVHVPRAAEHRMLPDEPAVPFDTLVTGVRAGLIALTGTSHDRPGRNG
jgi:pyroglutamyl-peptidase